MTKVASMASTAHQRPVRSSERAPLQRQAAISQINAPFGIDVNISRGINNANDPINTYTPAVTHRGALITNSFTTAPMIASAHTTVNTPQRHVPTR